MRSASLSSAQLSPLQHTLAHLMWEGSGEKKLGKYSCSSALVAHVLTRVRRNAEQDLRSSRRSCSRGATLSIKVAASANEFTAVRVYQRKLEMQLLNPRLAHSRVRFVHYLPLCSDAKACWPTFILWVTGTHTCSQTVLIGLQPWHWWRLQASASESCCGAEPLDHKCYVWTCAGSAQTSRSPPSSGRRSVGPSFLLLLAADANMFAPLCHHCASAKLNLPVLETGWSDATRLSLCWSLCTTVWLWILI